jgi:hypothetical protein
MLIRLLLKGVTGLFDTFRVMIPDIEAQRFLAGLTVVASPIACVFTASINCGGVAATLITLSFHF